MQLREIHIDGFGIFANKRITGFTSGINIIYGKNEFGKTTLLEFVRRILFGFPTKKEKVNLYPPLHGGSMGGSLKITLQDGEDIIISRSPGKHGGTVRVSTPNEILQGQSVLNNLLGNASKDIYKNIYAFTIDELHDFNTLNSDEVKNRIYGAGLGLGNVSLKAIEKEIEDRCKEIFKPKGGSRMGSLLEKIKINEQEILLTQKNLALFDELNEKLEKMMNQKLNAQNSLEDLESEKRTLETQVRLYEDSIQLLEAQSKLETLEDLSQFPENGLNTFESIKQEKQNLLLRIEEEQSALQTLNNNRDALVVNHDLLKREESIHRLQQSTQSVLSAIQDMDRVQYEREDLDMHITEEIKSIDRDWNEETVMAFDLTEAEKDQIDNFYDSFESMRKEVDLSKDRLESHRKMQAEKNSEGLHFPEWFKFFCYGLTATGCLGAIFGGYLINIPLLAIALFLTAVGIFLFRISTTNKQNLDQEDPVETNLAQQYDNKQTDLNYKFDEWRGWLKERNLDPNIAPITSKNIAKTSKQIKTMITQRNRLNERYKQMETLCKETQESILLLEPLVKNTSMEIGLHANIEIICNAFEESKANREKSNLLENQCQSQTEKLALLENQVKNISDELASFISSAGAKDSIDFLRKQSILDTQKLLKEKVAQKREIIQSNIGLGEHFNRFLEAVQISPLEEIKHKLSHIQIELEEVHTEREQLLQEIGETLNEIEKLSTNNELLAKQTQLETLKQQLHSLAREWAAYRGALVILDAAKQEYEKTRQPGVIRSAENLFLQTTGGNYRRIIKKIDTDEVLIEDDRHQRKGILEMSRGTREQLYLALRFGLIDEYETRSEPLPTVMDDIFVNFDDERDERITKILNKFGKSRQIIVLTCHQRSLEAYQNIGATAISV